MIGTDGETDAHDCPASRKIGATGSCTIEDYAKIGKLQTSRIENRKPNLWKFVRMTVEVVGALQLQGNGRVRKCFTLIREWS